LGFKGGKGVAASAGALFGLTPFVALIAVAVWLVIFYLTRYVSVASMTAALAVPIAILSMTFLGQTGGTALLYFSICLAAVVIVRHRSNLSRLVRGTEPRFKRK
jgi:glycerol-3-phosphate acyltransferase PlsY